MIQKTQESVDFVLHKKVQKEIINRISTGKFPPLSKLPGERKLCQMFSVNRGTLRQALRSLQDQRYLRTVPSKGTFVASGKRIPSKMNFIFPFPEASMSRDSLRFDVWARTSEVYRGMMDGAAANNIIVSFQHIKPSSNIATIEKQYESLSNFAGAVFLSSQYLDLMKYLEKRKFPFVLIDGTPTLSVPNVHWSSRETNVRKCARFLIESGYRTAGIIESGPSKGSAKEKKKYFTDEFVGLGGKILSKWVIGVPRDEAGATHFLDETLPIDAGLLPEVFFCSFVTAGHALMSVISKRGWSIPDDVGVLGYGNDMRLRPTVPKLTSLYIPYYEMGERAVELLSTLISGERTDIQNDVINAPLIIGESIKEF